MVVPAMTRWTRLIAAMICTFCVWAACRRSAEQTVDKGHVPAGANVLFVTLDTTRADRLGCYGYKKAGTPTLDALAARGTVFDDAQAPAPLTLPSHATMMTGRYPREHGLRVNARDRLDDARPTLAGMLRERGYRTAAFVASFVLNRRFGLDRGFELYDDDMGPAEQGEDLVELKRPANVVTDQALKWLQTASNKPFFCWVHYYDPHLPYNPPAKFKDRHPDPYDGEIAFMDSELKRIIDWLASSELSDRTLVVVAGDHGESFGEHGEYGHTTFVYETNLHVPLMFVYPGQIPAGGRVTTTVSLVDLFPTVLDLLGWPKAQGLLGQSLAPAFKGTTPDPRTCYAESEYAMSVHNWAPQRALINGEWKFVSSTKPELFDRRTDRAEQRNLAAEKPEVVARIRKGAEEFYRAMVPAPASAVVLSESARRGLEALGYVSGGGRTQGDEFLTPNLPDPKDLIDIMMDLKQVRKLFDSERFAEAVPLLEAAIKRSPRSSDILQRLGHCYMKTQRIEEAISTLQRALEIDPEYRPTLRSLADALLQARRIDEAVKYYKIVLDLMPDDARTQLNLGVAYLRSEHIDEAIERFRVALRLQPDYGDAMINLATALTKRGQSAEAKQILEQATLLPKSEGMAHFALAMLASQEDRGDEVIPHLELALEADRGNDRAAVALAQRYIANRKIEEAIRLLRRTVEHAPQSPGAALTLAEILASSQEDRLRNGTEAVALARKVVQQTGGRDRHALATLALALAEAGDFAAAAETGQQALTLAESTGDAKLAEVLRSQIEGFRARHPFRNPGL